MKQYLACSAVVGAMIAASALSGGTRKQAVPVRPLGPIIARTHDSLGAAGWVRQLSDGRVLVNDRVRRCVLLFDFALAHPSIVADTTGGTGKAYGNGARQPGALIPYFADSTLFLDEISLSLLVIDPRGKIARTMAIPMPRVSGELWANGPPGTDLQGRLVFRLSPTRTTSGLLSTAEDTAAVVRANLQTHAVDTVAFVKVHSVKMVPSGAPPDKGASPTRALMEPFYVEDDWALLTDGSVAIARGQDVHVDFVDGQGARTSGPEIPIAWQHVRDSDKVMLVDSLHRADSVFRSQLTPAMQTRFPVPEPVIAAEDIPDYRPAFEGGTARGDAEGNVWIKLIPMASDPPGGPIYMVVDRQGKLIDRVQLPGGCTLAGFGPGVVYLSSREGTGVILAKARIR